MKKHVGDNVGLIPMLGLHPTLSDHALGGEIHHPRGLEIIQRGHQTIEIVIQIRADKVESCLLCGGQPAIRQKTIR